ncbi:NAD(P)/FAD-dependent oxidoreductase [Blastococcus sp. CCUG 61487]|uniref:NAD(P)/FAD-dependent oxidoreductase n=1 Tax=Blastococcus sp. CCUG 61487 TaxID=1840703 RepID=UPI0010BFCFB9|nr:NAD(P)/FAD-dependent oxidoreductase [Blastococcus sp. CCUG 61487]TKJ18391.1 hypothetical protein A6V29_11730 [Blastococcus sp. CCUG 61487]
MPGQTTDRPPLEVDYLVVGAGAMGMAFVDTLLTETDATVAIVDRYAQPGGHWTRAYPYVRLHQPSVFYGVNSRELGTGAVDTVGLNAGLYELATVDEVLTYFDRVMRETFLPSGRVSYFPMSNHDSPTEDGVERFSSLVSGRITDVVVRRRVVEATYMNVTVPSMTSPRYAVADGVRVIPPNDLVTLAGRPAHFTVVGSGKTGIDACLWLLQHSVDPADITWIMPRDAWLFDRARIQPGPPSGAMGSSLPAGLELPPGTSALDLLIAGIEASGLVMRISPDVTPTAFRCATVTRAELEQLRQIDDVLRHGRVTAIDVDHVEFGDVRVPAVPGTLYVDCTADGLEPRPTVPVFDGSRMTLQAVIPCQQVFSAGLAAYVEANYEDDALRNELCAPCPHPSTHVDLPKYVLDVGTRMRRWSQDPALREWISRARSVVRVPDEENLQTDEAAAFIRHALAEAGASPAPVS